VAALNFDKLVSENKCTRMKYAIDGAGDVWIRELTANERADCEAAWDTNNPKRLKILKKLLFGFLENEDGTKRFRLSE